MFRENIVNGTDSNTKQISWATFFFYLLDYGTHRSEKLEFCFSKDLEIRWWKVYSRLRLIRHDE